MIQACVITLAIGNILKAKDTVDKRQNVYVCLFSNISLISGMQMIFRTIMVNKHRRMYHILDQRLGSFEDLRGFSDIWAISLLGSRRYPISEILAARPGIEPQPLDPQAKSLTTTPMLFLWPKVMASIVKVTAHTWTIFMFRALSFYRYWLGWYYTSSFFLPTIQECFKVISEMPKSLCTHNQTSCMDQNLLSTDYHDILHNCCPLHKGVSMPYLKWHGHSSHHFTRMCQGHISKFKVKVHTGQKFYPGHTFPLLICILHYTSHLRYSLWQGPFTMTLNQDSYLQDHVPVNIDKICVWQNVSILTSIGMILHTFSIAVPKQWPLAGCHTYLHCQGHSHNASMHDQKVTVHAWASLTVSCIWIDHISYICWRWSKTMSSSSYMYMVKSQNLVSCYCIQGKLSPVLFSSISPSDLRANSKLD